MGLSTLEILHYRMEAEAGDFVQTLDNMTYKKGPTLKRLMLGITNAAQVLHEKTRKALEKSGLIPVRSLDFAMKKIEDQYVMVMRQSKTSSPAIKHEIESLAPRLGRVRIALLTLKAGRGKEK